MIQRQICKAQFGEQQLDSWEHMSSEPPPHSESSAHPEEFFDFLLEKIPDQVYFKDRQGRFLRASRAVADYLDVADPNEIIGKSDFDFWSEDTAKEAAADEKRIMETRQPMVGKVERLVHPDGRVTWDYTTKMPLLDSRGNVIGICGINKDFTAMKEMQDALAEERNRLKATTEELEKKNAVLQADLQLAREIQEALLPRDYPTFPGFGVSGQNALSFAHCYLPAAAVGGDFFDIFPLSKTRAGILVCDVMGHGLARGVDHGDNSGAARGTSADDASGGPISRVAQSALARGPRASRRALCCHRLLSDRRYRLERGVLSPMPATPARAGSAAKLELPSL